MRHHHHHHHGRRYRRYRRRHHIPRPLVTTKHFTRITARQVLAIEPSSQQLVAGEWEATVALAWQQPEGLFGSAYNGFNFGGSEFLAHYKEYEQYAITGMRCEYTPVQYSSTAANGRPNILVGIWTFDDPDSYDPGTVDFKKACQVKDLRAKPINRRWHEYKDARAYSAVQNVAW